MAEREVLVDKARLTYEGLFACSELYKFIDEWLEEKNYDKRELKNVERVTAEGKYIEIEILPWKKVSDYAKNEIRVRLIMTNVKEVEVEKDGTKVKMNQGNIQIVFDAYLTTDYENRWEGKPVFFFLRTIFDKFLYKPWMSGFQSGCKGDCMELRDKIKAMLNLYRY